MERNEFIDILKGWAIFLVVMGHSIQFGSGLEVLEKSLFWNDIMFKYIYSYHMPLFMLISGYFFYCKIKKYQIKEIVLNRISSLLLPIVSCGIIQSLIVGKLKEADVWFLWAIIYISLIVLVINKCFGDSLKIYLLLWIIFLFTTDSNDWGIYKYMYPYFIIGYMSNKYKKNIFKFLGGYNTILLGCVFILLIYFYSKDIYIYISGYKIINISLKESIINFNLSESIYQIYIDLYRFIIGIIGCFFTINIINYIYINFYNKKIFNEISFLGKSSMSIYIYYKDFFYQY